MKIKTIAYSSLVLRILTLLSLIASIVVLVTDKDTTDDIQTTFKDLIAYRYVVSVASIGGAYTLLELLFAMHYACTEKRLIRDGCLPEFDFYGDKIISLLLATGVGAGFAISCELNRFFHARFFDKGNIAAGFLLGATVCMAVVSVLSSIDRTTSRGFFR
ncbi:CASP-like protein [Fagus crenata]